MDSCVLITKQEQKPTLAKTLFAAALTAVVFTSSAMATFAAEPVKAETKTSSLSKFNRIWVSGNVKIVLTQGDKQNVEGTSNYDAAKTSVSTDGKTLFINSLETSQVTLNITVKDLERIEAYGQSVVVTSNNLDVKYLQLILSQSATAKIKTTAGSLYTIVKDDAVLKLNGTADQSTMVASNMKNVKLADFATLKSASFTSEAIMEAEQNAMALAK
ncbi:GIN domain-containing protein [Pedobacter jamesrossensis]|uniref:GIN domain-containing protein n=1 Tax=Pedobacter jamesrossensis TaxID=1908238 RepID=A0ABV8NLW3_9SPHI